MLVTYVSIELWICGFEDNNIPISLIDLILIWVGILCSIAIASITVLIRHSNEPINLQIEFPAFSNFEFSAFSEYDNFA